MEINPRHPIINELNRVVSEDDGESENAAEETNNAMAYAMAQFKGPIIGAVNGHAVTGGFELANFYGPGGKLEKQEQELERGRAEVRGCICGSSSTLGSSRSPGLMSWPCSNTSRPAPASVPAMSIRVSGFASITSPRAVLTM